MVRKVTKAAVDAFYAGCKRTSSNTSVELTDTHVTLKLHGNAIARTDAGAVEITTAGWNTVTTRDRLNALDGVRVCTHKGDLYLNDFPWSGDWTNPTAWDAANIERCRVPNLDVIDLDELRYFFNVHKTGRKHAELFPAKPLGAAAVSKDLAAYAISALDARTERAEGRIEQALIYERICQDIYRKLPGWAKW